MKKILMLFVVAGFFMAGCKKKDNNVSTLHTYSTPTITISGAQYYSIPVGGALPSIDASAYDTFYNQTCPVIIDQSTLDNTTPGLYIVTASSKNQYGMIAYKSIYVAVTNISTTINLSGKYIRTTNSDTVNVTKLANGLYMTDNVGGVLYSTANIPFIIPAVFVQLDDTTLDMPSQATAQGTLYGTGGAISMSPGDTTFQYVIQNVAFAPSTRTFMKL